MSSRRCLTRCSRNAEPLNKNPAGESGLCCDIRRKPLRGLRPTGSGASQVRFATGQTRIARRRSVRGLRRTGRQRNATVHAKWCPLIPTMTMSLPAPWPPTPMPSCPATMICSIFSTSATSPPHRQPGLGSSPQVHNKNPAGEGGTSLQHRRQTMRRVTLRSTHRTSLNICLGPLFADEEGFFSIDYGSIASSSFVPSEIPRSKTQQILPSPAGMPQAKLGLHGKGLMPIEANPRANDKPKKMEMSPPRQERSLASFPDKSKRGRARVAKQKCHTRVNLLLSICQSPRHTRKWCDIGIAKKKLPLQRVINSAWKITSAEKAHSAGLKRRICRNCTIGFAIVRSCIPQWAVS